MATPRRAALPQPMEYGYFHLKHRRSLLAKRVQHSTGCGSGRKTRRNTRYDFDILRNTDYIYSVGRSIFFLFLIGIMLVLGSCTTTSKLDRGSLSDAMEKARDDYPEEREVPSERKDDPWGSDDDPWQEPAEDEESDERVYVSSPNPMYLGARGGNAVYSYPYFDSLFDAEILFGSGVDRGELLFFGGIKAVTAREDSAIRESVDEGVIFLRGGAEVRFYPLASWPVFSPYLLAQAGGLYMYWSFRNPLDAGSETITGDSVGGLFLAVGAGVNLINTKRIRLGTAWIPEVYLFYSETKEGFRNDVFDSYSTVRWSVEMGLNID